MMLLSYYPKGNLIVTEAALKVEYKSGKVKEQCTDIRKATRLFGGDRALALKLLSRINALEQADVIQDIIILINVAHQMIILCFMMISRKKVLCYVINNNVGMMEKSAWHIFQEASLKVSCITIIRTYI